MARPAGAALCLLLFACSEEPAPTQPETESVSKSAAKAEADSVPAAPFPRQPREPTSPNDAGKVVQAYYALVEAEKYEEAYALREPAPGAPTLEDFKANFERYAEYDVTVGAPSQPVESSGWLYVEVPVQPYGRMKDGSPLASAGMLTLRKRKGGGPWRIFTKA